MCCWRFFPCATGESLIVPHFDFYIVKSPGQSLVSFEISSEGVFLFITPLQLALLWPWTVQ